MKVKNLKSIGFKDCLEHRFPKLTNPYYMNGWLEALGMMHGYQNILPVVADENYFEGYEQAQEERKTNGERDIRDIFW
jgi:hypothetical protein